MRDNYGVTVSSLVCLGDLHKNEKASLTFDILDPHVLGLEVDRLRFSEHAYHHG